jgi:hypothetical protein
MDLPKGNYNVRITDAVLESVGEKAAMACLTTVSKDMGKHFREVKTPRGPALYAKCRGTKGTVLGVFIKGWDASKDDEPSDIIVGLDWEFGQGN